MPGGQNYEEQIVTKGQEEKRRIQYAENDQSETADM